MTSYLMVIVIFYLSLTVCEIFAKQEKWKTDIEMKVKVISQLTVVITHIFPLTYLVNTQDTGIVVDALLRIQQ